MRVDGFYSFDARQTINDTQTSVTVIWSQWQLHVKAHSPIHEMNNDKSEMRVMMEYINPIHAFLNSH